MKELIMKDLRLLVREKTIVSLIFFLIFTASFASLVTYGLIFLSSPQYVQFSKAKIGVVGDCPILKSVIKGKNYADLEDALRDFKLGNIDAIVYLPKENASSHNFVTVYLPKDEIATFIAASYIKEKLELYELKLREMNGIEVVKLRVFSEKKVDYYKNYSVAFKFIYVALIPLLVITTAIVASGLLIDSTTEEFESRSFEILMVAPMSKRKILFYKIFSAFLVSTILSAVWLLLLHLNGIEIANIPLFSLVAFSVYLIFISFALLTSLIFKDRERSQLFFSLIAAGVIAISFASKHSFAGVITRISVGSVFEIWEVATYLAIALVLLTIALKFGESRVGNDNL